MDTLLALFVVLVNGIAAGIMASTVIGIVPMMLALPYDRYVQTVHFLWPRYDPFMPIANGMTLLLDVVLALRTDDLTTCTLYIAAALLQACVITISVTKNVPVNRYVKSLSPDERPTDWVRTDPRRRWRAWNATRTGAALCAFVINVAAIAHSG